MGETKSQIYIVYVMYVCMYVALILWSKDPDAYGDSQIKFYINVTFIS